MHEIDQGVGCCVGGEGEEMVCYFVWRWLRGVVGRGVFGMGRAEGDAGMIVNNLKVAINKDASYKAMAKSDMEFYKFRDNAEYKSLVD